MIAYLKRGDALIDKKINATIVCAKNVEHRFETIVSGLSSEFDGFGSQTVRRCQTL
jgi:hypothetical protein